jgi:hypothetical protein
VTEPAPGDPADQRGLQAQQNKEQTHVHRLRGRRLRAALPRTGHRGHPLMTRRHHRAPRGAYAGTRASRTGE